jgi:hypothetical protein
LLRAKESTRHRHTLCISIEHWVCDRTYLH